MKTTYPNKHFNSHAEWMRYVINVNRGLKNTCDMLQILSETEGNEDVKAKVQEVVCEYRNLLKTK